MLDQAGLAGWATWPAEAELPERATLAARVRVKKAGMRLFLDSPIPYAIVTAVLGVLALLPAGVIGIDLIRGMDAFGGLMLLVTLPLAIGGLLALAGGVLILKRKAIGRILATIGLAIGLLHPLIAGVYSLMTIGTCGPLPRDCADRWFGAIVLIGGAGIVFYLVVALWIVRDDRRVAVS